MASATWPSDLPDVPLVRGYKESPPDLALRTEMDTGPDKTRRRTTAGPREFAVQFRLTPAQVATLDTFFVDTLKSGALRFDFTHPRTGNTFEFKFVGPPTYRALDSARYRVQATLELMP